MDTLHCNGILIILSYERENAIDVPGWLSLELMLRKRLDFLSPYYFKPGWCICKHHRGVVFNEPTYQFYFSFVWFAHELREGKSQTMPEDSYFSMAVCITRLIFDVFFCFEGGCSLKYGWQKFDLSNSRQLFETVIAIKHWCSVS